jgi:hypothetical protein
MAVVCTSGETVGLNQMPELEYVLKAESLELAKTQGWLLAKTAVADLY